MTKRPRFDLHTMATAGDDPLCHPDYMPLATEQDRENDNVRWLALLLLKASLTIADGVRARYRMKRGEKCPRCSHTF